MCVTDYFTVWLPFLSLFLNPHAISHPQHKKRLFWAFAGAGMLWPWEDMQECYNETCTQMFLSSISHLTVANNLLNNLVLNVSVLIIKFADYMKIGSVVDN